MSKHYATTPDTEDFTERELQVISEALKEYLTNQGDTSGDTCDHCGAIDIDDPDAGDVMMITHDDDCPIRIATNALAKIGVMVPE